MHNNNSSSASTRRHGRQVLAVVLISGLAFGALGVGNASAAQRSNSTKYGSRHGTTTTTAREPSTTMKATTTTIKTTTTTTAAPSQQIPIRSGLPWASGVFHPTWNAADATAFGTWRGSATDVIVTWPARAKWTDFINTNTNYSNYTGTTATMVYGIPMIPEADGANIADCVNGSYNDKWKTFANTLKANGLQNSVIRLGWEFNLHTDWGTPEQFAACYRQIQSTADVIAPGLQWDWNVNRGSSSGMSNDAVLAAYPGNAFVDIIGVDSYNWWGDWQWQLNGSYGLKYWLDFAKAHGKKFSVPEWGVFTASSASHGDDASYIQNMYDFFAANASTLAYEAYFNESAAYYGGSIYGPIQNPLTSAKYKALW